MLEMTSHLGWSFLSADRILDHWQVEWSLLKVPWHWCEHRLLDAWAWRVAQGFRSRKTAERRSTWYRPLGTSELHTLTFFFGESTAVSHLERALH